MDVHETNGGGDFDGISRIRRHVKSVLDGYSFFGTLFTSINQQQVQATKIFEDNQGAVSLSKGSKIAPRTKHIDIKFHHVRSLVAKGVVT